METHNAAVAVIAQRVGHFYKDRKSFRLWHGSTNSTRPSQRRADNTVDTSKLNHVLKVDRSKMVAMSEPNVPMDALVQASLENGLVPLVVMEFPSITVGGGFSGTSGESSSFRHSTFDATVNAIEIVLANGHVTMASKTDKPDLFWGAASAFGTLGVVTLLEVQLRPAKRFVQLTYHLLPSVPEANTMMELNMAKDDVEYIDGIVFQSDATIVCTGKLVEGLPSGGSPRRFTRARDPWFYIHVQRVLKRLRNLPPGATETDYIPVPDYLFRYDRGGFWAGRYAFRYFITPFNRITRFILNPGMHTSVMYRALHKSGLDSFYVIQDVGIPYDRVPEFQAWLDAELPTYPLWLCPLRLDRNSPDSSHGLHSEFGKPGISGLMNFGIWGPAPGPRRRRDVFNANRALERKVLELGGKKWLYGHAYYPEDEFWAHYDRKAYDEVRKKYHADHLPSVYDKVKVDFDAEEARRNATFLARLLILFWSIWPLSGLYGVWFAILGGDYLLQQKAEVRPSGVREKQP